MNILVDAHVFDDKHQGTRSYLKGLYSHLIPMAKDWHFFMAANDIVNLQNEFGYHDNVTYIQLKHINKFYRLLVELPSIMRKHEIDYTHFQYISSPIKVGRHIVTTHDILFEQKEFKSYFPLKYRLVNGLLFKSSAKKADILLTVSNYSRRKISELYKINIDEIHLTPNAVGPAFAEHVAPEITNDIHSLGKYILYVARIEPRKNHLALLKAFTELRLADQGYKLVFVGKKDLPNEELDAYIRVSDAINKSSVVWLDNIPNNALPNYYKQCELFVFPSFAEGFGIPPLEAMAAGSKVLCSMQTAMKDFELPDALSFDPHNIEELKQKMEVQLKSNEVLKSVYQAVLSKYNWSHVARDLYKLISNHHINS